MNLSIELVKKAAAGLAVFATLIFSTSAWSADLGDIQKQISAKYPTAKATADGTDLVTAGAVLVLQKDNLVMCPVDHPIPTSNFYKNGAITQGGLGGFIKAMSALNRITNAQNQQAPATMRTFVTGEKFFVTHIATAPDGVIFTLMSDPIKDQRYKASLKFAFAKGETPSPDEVAAMVGEVLKVDADSGAPEQAGNASPQQAAPAATKTIAIGQTRDQVVAAFGVPTKVVNLGAKEIDFFADMKVTFVNNKVSNVE